MEIYKPHIEKNNVAGVKSAPQKITDLKEVKTIDQKKAEGTKSDNPQVKNETPNQQKEKATNIKTETITPITACTSGKTGTGVSGKKERSSG